MSQQLSFGEAPWSRREMRDRLAEFMALYDQRPFKDNTGGMRSPHMFMAWFALQKLQPRIIVESGVLRGQGTWLFERACPKADLYCIDIDLEAIRYRSSRATYCSDDFSTQDWSTLPKADTVLFFDDHQNAYERVKTAKWFGFTHLFFEDNYPARHGDCYSLKKAFMHAGHESAPRPDASATGKLKKLLGVRAAGVERILPNDVDAKYLRQNLAAYHELPPVFKPELTRWGEAWTEPDYPTPQPLLQAVEHEHQQTYWQEAAHYTWLCYARLA